MSVFLVSACLLGLCTRYDSASKPSDFIKDLTKKHILIPFCPEQLGGLPTPRPPAELIGGDGFAVLAGQAWVITNKGENVTKAFTKGAEEAVKLAKLLKVKHAFVKARSPSCGLNPVVGVAAAKLILEGLSLEEID